MSEHFIRNIEIKNFKLFKDFKAEGFGRVNLIGGKNNVGKTAFMEALELNITSLDVFSLAFSLSKLVRRRQHRYFELDFLHNDSSDMQINTNIKKIAVKYYNEQSEPSYYNTLDNNNLNLEYEPSLKLTVNNNEKVFSVNRIIDRPIMMRKPSGAQDEMYANFISSTTTEERDIAILYGKLVDLNKEDFLNTSLKLFDKNIIALKQKATERDVVLKLSLENQEFPVLLSSLGEGVNRYIAILSAIWASKDGFLFIDEIENGIHNTNYDKLWKVILKTSKEANVQIFATTHSKECIESYARVARKLEDNEIGFIELGRNKKGAIDSVVMDSEMFQRYVKLGNEVRGW